MHLKTLTIKGFKSFADSIDLELQNGVTVVVGPNGSGKSNVVDAIAWVLGAQAPSAVRSQKMDDVIFAGTADRPALGRAEVSLVIDNADGQLHTEFSEIQITRTLFRTGDSEYSLNGVPCRLLDIQELLSDSGVGRTQHVIVSQGQIDAVLNATPEERRLIIEEAAGVLKFRKRREKAQRRLHASEASQTRVQDLLREVRRQLRPLEKQADAARRHGDVVAELLACQIWLSGRQLATLRKKMATHASDRATFEQRTNELRALLGSLDADVVSVESDLSAQGAVDLGDALARLEGLHQRSRGTAELLAERQRGIGRQRQATIDADIVATLRSESADLEQQLAELDDAKEQLAPEIGELERSEASLAEDLSSFEAALASATGEGATAAAAGRAAEVRGERAALQSAADRAADELASIGLRLNELAQAGAELEERQLGERNRLQQAIQREEQLVVTADQASARRVDSEQGLAAARAERAEADAERRATEARRSALAEALDSARTNSGIEGLGGLDGVVGTMLDVLVIDSGWELAVEAALGSAMSAVLVESGDGARRALERLDESPGYGTVLSLDTDLLGADSDDRTATSLRPDCILDHVRSPRPDVAAALHRLLADVVVTTGDWHVALDRSIDLGGAVVVTKSGDRIGGSMWRVGGDGVGATRAALEAATASVESATAALLQRDSHLVALEAEAARIAEEDRAAAAALDSNDAELTSTTEALHQIDTQRRQLATEHEALERQGKDLEHRLARERARIGELDQLLPGLVAAEAESAERSRELEATRRLLNDRGSSLQTLRTELEVRSAAFDERRGVLHRRLGEIQSRLGRLANEGPDVQARTARLDRTEKVMEQLRNLLLDTIGHLDSHLEERRAERREQSKVVHELSGRLDGLRAKRSAAEIELRETAERAGRVDIDEAETRLRLETLTEVLRRDLDIDPDAALAAPQPELPEGVTPAGRARDLERDLKIMGPINPLALQEFEALQERHEFLNDQLSDIRATRRELNKVIRAIDDEIVSVFAAAYADVADNFQGLFERLFPGGRGSLSLTAPNDLLETGIDVSAKPSGKNVKKLSLLSGGERSLTALAFLFAVFRSRPSPFYVMDEVEAALDDVNLHRFLSLVDEFRAEAQLVIVSHQKRTMEAADCLYGVTMEPGGSSVVVSERSDVVAMGSDTQESVLTS